MTARKDFDALDEFDRFDESAATGSGDRPGGSQGAQARRGDADDDWGVGPDDERDLHDAHDAPSKTSDEDGRGSDGGYDAWGQESAFSDEPLQVVEEVKDNEPAMESAEDWAASSDDAPMKQASDGPKSNKPNPVILGAAALMGLAVLGGAGWMGWSMLSSSGASGPMVAPAPAAPALAGASGADAFLMPGQPGQETAESSGFDDWDDDAANTGASTGADVAGAAAAPLDAVSAPSASSVAPSSVPAAPPAPSAASAAAPAAAAPAAAAPSRAEPRVQRAAAASAPRSASRPEPRSATQPAQAAAPREEVLGDQRLRVVAVYPHSGRHTQAWLRDESTGATHAVRVGDAFRGGRVREIQPEQMRVVLEDGRRFGVRGLEAAAGSVASVAAR